MESNQPVAVIDVGSNSIKLLVARREPGSKHLETLFLETIETRISEGINRARPELTEAAIAAGCATILELVQLARHYEPTALKIVATSAVRDAINGEQFKAAVLKATGISIRILSGMEEATYIGHGISCDPAIQGMDQFTQVDLGGGSLELVRFEDGAILSAISLPLGAVRLTEKFIRDTELPVSPEQMDGIKNYTIRTLRESDFSFGKTSGPLVATGGAFSVIRSILATGRGQAIETSEPQLSREDILELKQTVCASALHDRLSIPHLPAARADIIPAALITICALLDVTGHPAVTHSYYNLKYGIARELLAIR